MKIIVIVLAAVVSIGIIPSIFLMGPAIPGYIPQYPAPESVLLVQPSESIVRNQSSEIENIAVEPVIQGIPEGALFQGASASLSVSGSRREALPHLSVSEVPLEFNFLEDALDQMIANVIEYERVCNNEENRWGCDIRDVRPVPVDINLSEDQLEDLIVLFDAVPRSGSGEEVRNDGTIIRRYTVFVEYQGEKFIIAIFARWSP